MCALLLVYLSIYLTLEFDTLLPTSKQFDTVQSNNSSWQYVRFRELLAEVLDGKIGSPSWIKKCKYVERNAAREMTSEVELVNGFAIN